MQIKVTLHSMLRKKLPDEAHGRTTLEMAQGSTIADVLTKLDITVNVICSVNNRIEHNLSLRLNDGDDVRFLLPIGGG